MPELIYPEWPAPANVRAVTTTRIGGVSEAPWDSFNLADHVGDDADAVSRNRSLLAEAISLPAEPYWLQQEHGDVVVEAGTRDNRADASWSDSSDSVCAVLTADCLPLLLCDRSGNRVCASHAGWRGLAAGVIENSVACFPQPEEVIAWLGPAIGPDAFQVGRDVVEAFTSSRPEHDRCFRPQDEEHWLCDIYGLAGEVLRSCGVTSIYGGELCTFTDDHRFYSYRRDGTTGRIASLIWLG